MERQHLKDLFSLFAKIELKAIQYQVFFFVSKINYEYLKMLDFKSTPATTCVRILFKNSIIWLSVTI